MRHFLLLSTFLLAPALSAQAMVSTATGNRLDNLGNTALSAAQMAQLTNDIVWLVEKDITLPNGTTTKALVPQLYVHVQGGDLQAGGALIVGNNLNLNITGNLLNGGTIAGRQVVALTAENLNNLGGRILGTDVGVAARTDLHNLGGTIAANKHLVASAGRDVNVTSTTRTQTNAQGHQTHIDRVAGLYVTGNTGTLLASAGGDINLIAAAIQNQGRGESRITANNDLHLGTLTQSNRQQIVWDSKNRRSDASRGDIGSTIQTQGNLTLAAGNDLTAQAAHVTSHQGNLLATAGNKVQLTAGEANVQLDEAHQHKGRSSAFSRKTITTRDTLDQTTAQATTFSGNSTTVLAGQDLTLRGATLTATHNLDLWAGRDLKIDAAQANHSESHDHKEKKSGLSASLASGIAYGKASAQQNGAFTETRAVASQLDGENIHLQARRDASLTGALLLADRDLRVATGRNLDILAAHDSAHETFTAKSSSTRLQLLAGGAPRQTGFSKNSARQQQDSTQDSAVPAFLSANAGDLTLLAGIDPQYRDSGQGNLSIEGADLLAGQSAHLQGNAVHLTAASSHTRHDETEKQKSFTLGAALAGTIGGQITRAYDMVKAAHEGTGNRRLDTALALKGGYDAWKALDALNSVPPPAAEPPNPKGNGSAFGVSISIGRSQSQRQQHAQSHTERGTELQARDIALIAQDTDLTAVGAKLQAERDITLIAPKDILLTAAQNRQTLENKNSGRQTGVGVTVGFGQQTGISFQLGASRQQGQADGSEITHDNTQITAGNTLRLQSGNDTTLSGAQLAAKRLEAQIGGDLAIETRQDQNYYQNRQKSGGFAVSLCLPPLCYGMSSGSLSAASQKIDHHYQSAVGQSGLAAGTGGFDLDVAAHTRLTGAAITSAASEETNRLRTQSLVFTDLQNEQQTKSHSASLSIASGLDPAKGTFTAPGTSLAGQAATNLLANLASNAALPDNHHETSHTQSLISPAKITITGTGDAAQDRQSRESADRLTQRDPATAHQALQNSLTLQQSARLEQQLKTAQQTGEAARLIGEVAAGMIGDIAEAMQKPWRDAAQRQYLENRQKAGNTPLTPAEQHQLARLDREGMTAEKAQATLADPNAKTNHDHWQTGGTVKTILHSLAGVLQAKVGNGNLLAGALSGGMNEALIPVLSDTLAQHGILAGTEAYKGYLQLGSALLGASIGAIIDGTPGAALAGTVAQGGTTFNYLKHDEAHRIVKLKEKQFLGQCGADCQQEIADLEQTDKARNDQLRACEGNNSTPCQQARQAVREAAAGYLRNEISGIDQITLLLPGSRYVEEKAETAHYADDTLSGMTQGRMDAATGMVIDTAQALYNASKTLLKSVQGDETAQEALKRGAGAAWDKVKQLESWPYLLLGKMTPEQREQLAQAYEQGDGTTVGRITGEQALNVLTNLPSGGTAGTIKLIKFGEKAEEAAAAIARAEKAGKGVREALEGVKAGKGGNSGKGITNDVLSETRIGNGTKGQGSGNKVEQLPNKQVVGSDGKPIPVYENKPTGPYATQEFPSTPIAHGFPNIVDNYANSATKFTLNNGASLYQAPATYNGVAGRFEWIVDPKFGGITHRMFVPNGSINGIPVKP